ncbi:MAG: rRNA maturation RNase YbeY [Nitrospirae bacterium]|jgi:rRNA maturation RNase YbeY|nr:rRNA maturation RNase YbeY [Nitrospirota bacterium]
MAVYLRVRLTQLAVRQASLMRVAELVLEAIGETQSELSVELVGDQRMRRLNREYRKKDRSTDVLAFAMRESHNPCPTMLGDVVISVPTAIRQAREAGRSLNHELAALLVHGVLHLCGYDHERNKKEAARMHRRERAILRTIGPVPSLVTRRAEPRERSR